MKTPRLNKRRSLGGFTLAEMSISMAIVTIVMVGVFNIFVQVIRSYNATSLVRNAAVRASMGLDRMVVGVGTNAGLREAQASTVTITSNSGWQIAFNSGQYFQYSTTTKSITDQSGKTICTNVVASTISSPSGGCQISASVAETGGGRSFTNTMTTFVQFRN
jgi:prepilin-type N-terminal cleavage/methylation domain-containing protein